ncbi:reverse transcriptase domain-containing protein [Tanacetum coccineum]
MRCLKTPSKFVKSLMFGALILMGSVPVFTREQYILVAVDYLSKWVEAKALPTNEARVLCKFLKISLSRICALRAIISDRGTHICNDHLQSRWQKYGSLTFLSRISDPQTSGQSWIARIVKALVFSVLSIRSLELQILSFILGIPIS